MDYAAIYANFIESRQFSRPVGYCEIHHILPRALGGDDAKENLIALSQRDHYFAHCCLAKIHGGAMWLALHAVCSMPKRTARFLRGRLVAKAREQAARHRSAFMNEQWASGEFSRVREYGPLSAETRARIADANRGKRQSPDSIAKAQASKQARAPVYQFTDDGRSFTGTVVQFVARFGEVSPEMARLLARGVVKSASGWRLATTEKSSILGRNPTVLVFKNVDGRQFVGTRYAFRTHYDLDAGVISNLINGKNRVKSFKGWRVHQG